MPPIAAQAQEKYPSRPVRLIVPTPAGGVYDLMGRLFMDRIGPSLGTVVVENRARRLHAPARQQFDAYLSAGDDERTPV
jgi:hypothetical protein